MRFLFDACSSAHVIRIALESQDHDFLCSCEAIEASAPDSEVLALSADLDRVLVFKLNKGCTCIIHLYDLFSTEKKAEQILTLVEREERAMSVKSFISIRKDNTAWILEEGKEPRVIRL